MIKRTRTLSLPALSAVHIWLIVPPLMSFALTSLTPVKLADFWWHIKIGEIIFTEHRIPTTNIFSFVAADNPYQYHEWLGALLLYLPFRIGGAEGAIVLEAIILAAVAVLVTLMAWEGSHDIRIASLCSLVSMGAVLIGRGNRPQTFAFLFFAIFYLLLSRYRQKRPSPLWLMPLLTITWANTHGSVILGFALTFLTLSIEAAKSIIMPSSPGILPPRKLIRLGLVTASLPAAMSLNPWGPGIFTYFLDVVGNPVVKSQLTEWAPASLRTPESIPFLVTFMACAAIFALSPKSLDVTDAALFIVFSVMALLAVRNSMWFGIIVAPIAARQLCVIIHDLRSMRNQRQMTSRASSPSLSVNPTRTTSLDSLLAYIFAFFLVGASALALPWFKSSLSLPEAWKGSIDYRTPVKSVSYVASRFPAERFFHPMSYGGYMIWDSPLRPQVFVDGRIDGYPLDLWQDYFSISMALGWQERLSKYGIRGVILAKDPELSYPLLLQALTGAPGWKQEYEDDRSIIFVQTDL